MISSRNFYLIGDIINRVYNYQGNGGFAQLNVILVFDFRQLPPPPTGGPPLYTLKFQSKSEKLRLQDEAGQFMFSQFLIVVILRTCMRTSGPYLRMLNQMCVGACDVHSLALFQSCMLQHPSCVVNMNDPSFWPVSILSTRNKRRDYVNDAGVKKFSIIQQQELVTFCSLDTYTDSAKRRKFLPASIQAALWEMPPTLTEHIAGLLRLCYGLPVLIKRNLSVGSGVTNGAEGFVVGWTSFDHQHYPGMNILDVLYVKLIGKYAETVFDQALGPGIVPIVPVSNAITVDIPGHGLCRISRRMHQVLPNFAMTDYASQGKGRQYNLFFGEQVCRIQSMYTMASRSTQATTTGILGHVNLQLL
ncbi:hypothetical protein BDR26DRAFT_790047, partial [Obelidium mucronatum]